MKQRKVAQDLVMLPAMDLVRAMEAAQDMVLLWLNNGMVFNTISRRKKWYQKTMNLS